MNYLQSKNRFLLMHDWKKLLIALHYINDRTHILILETTRILQIQCFFQVNLKTKSTYFSGKLSKKVNFDF